MQSNSYQRGKLILKWALHIFGPCAKDPQERAMRVLEEATELAHAMGLQRDTAHLITERVYARPAGEIRKELAQLGVTAECIAAMYDLNFGDLYT